MQLLKLRYFQIKRDLGVWVFLLAILATGLTVFMCDRKDRVPYIFIGVCVMTLYNHYHRRKDLNFLKRYVQNHKVQISLNYLISILPITVGLAISKQWYLLLLCVSATASLPFIGTSDKHLRLQFINRYIPSTQFEWISGLRRSFALIVLVLIVTLMLSPVKLFPLIGLFILNSIFAGFYYEFEPRYMLNPSSLSNSEFLQRKVAFTWRMILYISLPVLLINCVFEQDMIAANAFYLIGFMIMAAGMVYLKYAQYEPGEQLKPTADSLFLALGVLVPYLLPLSLLIAWNNRKKAIQHLSNYFNDQDKNT